MAFSNRGTCNWLAVGCAIVGLLTVAAVITTVSIGYASYVQGKAKPLGEGLTCTSGCYSEADYAEMRRPWEALLNMTVSTGVIDGITTTVVDYAALQKGPASELLDEVLEILGALDLSRVAQYEGLALLLNAYNAFTVHLVASNLDGLETVKSLSTMMFPRTTWNTRQFLLGGHVMTLDDIEHGNIRGKLYDEPRIHAALNCASVSCPDLRPEPYSGPRLGYQLEEQMIGWMNNPRKGMLLDRQNNTLYLPRLFKWYGNDFAPIPVEQFACQYSLEGDACQYIARNRVRVKYRKHNWGLNSMRSSAVPVVAAGDGGRKKTRGEIDAADDIGPHAEWDKLLQWVVSPGSIADVSMNLVDYSKLGGGSDPQLQAYLEWLATEDINRMPKREQLATLLNAYNAFTMYLVAKHFVGNSTSDSADGLTSLLDLDDGDPWDSQLFELGGRNVTLNQLHHGWIRGLDPSFGKGFSEPRIHAAVNSASVSCPDLRAEAYTAKRLDEQLDLQMETWLNSASKGLQLDLSGRRPSLSMSPIFSWYAEDFVTAQHPASWTYACRYHETSYALSKGTPEVSLCGVISAAGDSLEVSYMEYNWDLNHLKTPRPAVVPVSPETTAVSSFFSSSDGH